MVELRGVQLSCPFFLMEWYARLLTYKLATCEGLSILGHPGPSNVVPFWVCFGFLIQIISSMEPKTELQWKVPDCTSPGAVSHRMQTSCRSASRAAPGPRGPRWPLQACPLVSEDKCTSTIWALWRLKDPPE